MRTFAALLLKEEKAIFTSPIAYVVLSMFLVIMGSTFTLTLFVSHVPTLVHLFFQIYVLFLLTVPIITMRLVAEERRLRTIEILLTAPVSEPAVVFAKYLASLSLVALMLVLSGAYAITLGILGQPDWGPIYSGYFGLFLLGAALVAVGLMTSSLVNRRTRRAAYHLARPRMPRRRARRRPRQWPGYRARFGEWTSFAPPFAAARRPCNQSFLPEPA